VAAVIEAAGFEVTGISVVPDEVEHIKDKILELSRDNDLVVTTGGTGPAVRDVTPEATRAVIERELPGFGETMRASSLKITPHAILSCATAGLVGRSLVVNLPGSPKGAVENLEAVLGVTRHAIEIWQGKTGDCADS
jgi:molybdenum cofactor synthesis domain-containing protein